MKGTVVLLVLLSAWGTAMGSEGFLEDRYVLQKTHTSSNMSYFKGWIVLLNPKALSCIKDTVISENTWMMVRKTRFIVQLKSIILSAMFPWFLKQY